MVIADRTAAALLAIMLACTAWWIASRLAGDPTGAWLIAEAGLMAKLWRAHLRRIARRPGGWA